MKNKLNLLLVLFLLTTISINATERWTCYTSGNFVTKVKMNNNDLWVGTYGGGIIKLNTLTGDTTLYNKINSKIQCNHITAIETDNSGNLLVGFYEAGLMKFDGVNWIFIDSLKSSNISDIAVDKNNVIWVASNDSLFKIESGVVSVVKGLPDDDFTSIEIDSNNVVWLGTYNRGLIKYDHGTVSSYKESNSQLPGDEITDIVIDNNGYIWIAAKNDGLVRIDGTNWTIWNYTSPNFLASNIYDLAVDASNNIWMTGYGIAKFDGVNFTSYETTNSAYPGNWSKSIAIDAAGNKWVGNEEYSLYKFDDSNWLKYDLSNCGLSNNLAVSMKEDKFGVKWLATNSYWNGLTTFDGTNWTTYNLNNSGFTPNHCWAIDFDSKGNAWFATWYGLFKFNRADSTWVNYNTTNSSIPTNNIHYLAIDSSDKIWMASNDMVVTFDGNTSWYTHNLYGAGPLHEIKFDKNGYVWVTSDGKGLYKYKYSWTNYNTSNSGIMADYVSTVCIDHNNVIWVGGNAGISKFNGTSTWTNYDKNSFNISHSAVRDIEVDKNNNVWFSFINYGLLKYDQTKWTIYNQKNSPVPTMFVNSVSIDSENKKWIAISDGGYLVLDDNNTSGFEELLVESNVSVSPNPLHDYAVISFKQKDSEKCVFNLYDLNGREVLFIDNITENSFKLSRNGLANGIYIYKLWNEGGLIGSGKIIVQ